ncbi:hypothetical protein BRADI_1g07303v3 [Brachypodium distachyon]|uniref:Uncharacterized protein n=1 Tax=Brachypodium distachyon TaxID=15368 RepID=A0A2K2DIG1_BRADI|nr:hypothetical protein BRADI_1g07303v3 [Brachypodium distachyon]
MPTPSKSWNHLIPLFQLADKIVLQILEKIRRCRQDDAQTILFFPRKIVWIEQRNQRLSKGLALQKGAGIRKVWRRTHGVFPGTRGGEKRKEKLWLDQPPTRRFFIFNCPFCT